MNQKKSDINKTRTFINPHQEEPNSTKEMKSVAPITMSKSPEIQKHLQLEISVSVHKQPSVSCVSSHLVQALRKPTRVEKKDFDCENDYIPKLTITDEGTKQEKLVAIKNPKGVQSNLSGNRKSMRTQKESFQQLSENVKEDEDQLNDSSELQETNCTTRRHRKSNSNYQTSSLNSTIHNNQTNNSSPYGIDSKYQNNSVKVLLQPHKKQQEIKASSISNKRLIQTTENESSKPLVELGLNLAMTNISKFSENHLQNLNLRSIDVRNNKIGQLPDELFNLEHLWKLQVDQNLVEILPNKFQKLKDLKVFTISSNLILDLPLSLFWENTQIERLDISQNKISKIPYEIGNAQNLKYLLLQDNKISELPTSLHNCQKLQEFSIEWLMYVAPLHQKYTKIQQKESESQCLVKKSLNIFKEKSKEDKFIPFLEFTRQMYDNKDIDSILNGLKVGKKQSMIHMMSRQNHYYLYDSLSKDCKKLIDINNQDVYGNTSLQVAIENKNIQMIDRILREFKDNINFMGNTDESFQEINPSKKHMPLLHPLILSVRKQLIEYAIRIFRIIVKQNQKEIDSGKFDFNLVDDNKNTLFHYIFQNFSNNMEQNVELCQELLKLGERCQSPIFNINSLNKYGLSPIDLAIENKQNQALEFAIYYNKNQLPGCQSESNQKYQKFNLNNCLNAKSVTPLHRAIISQNYRAIYLLLSSGECQLLQKDKDFRSARDYCQRALFLFKYLRKGEMNYIRSYFEQNKAFSEFKINPIRRKVRQQMSITAHNHISFSFSGKIHHRVKYNSQYNKRTKKIVSNSQQHTLEKNEFESNETFQKPAVLDDFVLIDNLQEDLDILNEGVKSTHINMTSNLKTTKDNHYYANTRQLVSPMGTFKGKSTQSCQKPKINSEILQPRQPHSSNDLALYPQGVKKDKPNFRVLSKNTMEFIQEYREQNQEKKKMIEGPSATIDSLNSSLNGQYNRRNMSNQKKLQGDDEIDDFYSDLDSSLDRDLDSPSAMPSMKFNYVLNPNSSALCRKPYYKQLQRNQFESQFCVIIDCRTPFNRKLENLYSIYSIIQSTQDQQKLKDGREILAFLRLELENRDESVLPLKNEIEYFQDILHIKKESSTQLTKRNTIIAVGKCPLPSIKENDVEDFFAKSPSKNLKSTASLNSRSQTKNQLHYYKRTQVNTVKIPNKQDIPRPIPNNKQQIESEIQKSSLSKNHNLSVTVDQNQLSPKIYNLPQNMIEPFHTQTASHIPHCISPSPINPNFSLIQVQMSSRAKEQNYVKKVGVTLIEKNANSESKQKKQKTPNQKISPPIMMLQKMASQYSNSSSNYASATPLAKATQQIPPETFLCKNQILTEQNQQMRSTSNLRNNPYSSSAHQSSKQLNKSQVSHHIIEKNEPRGSDIIVGSSRNFEYNAKISHNSKVATLKQSLINASIKSENGNQTKKWIHPTSCKSSISSNNSKYKSKRSSMKK